MSEIRCDRPGALVKKLLVRALIVGDRAGNGIVEVRGLHEHRD
jgi:hypothetical protein